MYWLTCVIYKYNKGKTSFKKTANKQKVNKMKGEPFSVVTVQILT